jgi:hypothetical protein
MARQNEIRGLNVHHKSGLSRRQIARRAVLGAVVISAAAPVVSASVIYQAPDNVTSITTTTVSDGSSVVNADKGTAFSGTYSGFTASHAFNVSYGGQDVEVTSVTGGGVTYNASSMGTVTARRLTTPTNDNDQLWYVGTGTAAGAALKLNGPALGGFNAALDTNNIDLGADNLFSNTGNTVGNNSNVTRLDVEFGGFAASNLSAFSIMDRGPTNDHDAFKIAAITGVDKNGNPTSYGPLLSYSDGSWGTTNLMASTEELILRKNDSSSGPLQPSDVVNQTLGGVIVPTTTLVPAGTTVYGYSLFAPTVTGSGTELTQWTNATYFPLANETSTGGGLDPAATVGVLFTTAASAGQAANPTGVPEPASLGLAAVVCGGLLGRRSRRRTA